MAQASRQQKLQYIKEIKNLTNYYNLLFDNYFFEDATNSYMDPYNNTLINKYYNDFTDIENKFQVKMQILNETRNIKDIIETEKKNLLEYQQARFNVWSQYYNYSLQTNYILFDIFWTYNETIMISTAKCDPCTDSLKYSSCLKVEENVLKEPLDKLKFNIQHLSKDIETLSKVNRWDFLNNARRASRDAFNVLNRTLTIQQVKDYYRLKLVPLYEIIISVREKEHNYWHTENLITSGKTILNILQFVLDKIKQPVTVESNCDYVSVIKNLVNVVSSRVLPYKKFPLWDLDDFAAKYIRPVTNIKDVDLLIKILEDALRAAKKETKSNLPAFKYPGQENEYESGIILGFRDLIDMVRGGYCSGISVIKDAGQAAWDVFDCFAQLQNNDQPFYWLHQYVNRLNGFVDYNNCYEKTQNV